MADDPPTERRYDKNGRDITARIAAMKAKNPKPASGIPAGGKGWGGGASGDRPRGEKTTLTDANRRTGDLERDPETGRYLKTVATMEKEEIELELKEFYLEKKRDEEETTLNRLAAADKLFDRTSGKALQTVAGKDGAPLFPALRVMIGDDGT